MTGRMTPDFAIHFSVEGITLDQRTPDGWDTLAEASFTSGQFTTEIADLRTKGEAAAVAAGTRFAPKLILPNDQIKFLTLRDDTATRTSVAMALEGATPYALSELEFDWQSGGGTTRIAAVARETLEEAEAFALEHKLNPSAFVALPDEGWSKTEAFFGPAKETGGRVPMRDPLPFKRVGEITAFPKSVEEVPEAETTEEQAETPDVTTKAAEEELPAITATPDAPAEPQATADAAPEPAAFQSVRQTQEGDAPSIGAATTAPVDVPRKITLSAEAPEPEMVPNEAPPVTGEAEQTRAAPKVTVPTPTQLPDAGELAATLKPAASSAPSFQSVRKVAAPELREFEPEPDELAEAPAIARPVGKPRFLGLILTIILMVALLAVAAWAAVSEEGLARFFNRGVPDAPEAPAVALATPEGTAPSAEALAITPTPLERSAIDPPQEVLPDPGAEEGAEAVPGLEALANAPFLSQAELERVYAATGIWQRAPDAPNAPVPSELDTFYVTSIDAPISNVDAVALVAPSSFDSDLRPSGQPVPAGPETSFVFGPDGRIIPTEEGAPSPLGFTVFAGRPPLIAPLRIPEDKAQELEQLRLAAFRPQARPATLVEDTERRQLGGFSRSELAAFRPQLRPETAKAIEEVAEPDEPASQYAVAQSLRPSGRPRNADRIIANTRASQPTTVAVAAAVAPRVTNPTGSTRASVARAATTTNAINLRRVNLIGVYGTPSNRSALVRLANGRFVKVQVGDRMDGGQVAAISESALRYVKRGRNIVLEIPTG